MNRYGFAGGNPITLIEFDGHVPASCEGGCLRDFGIAQTQHASDVAASAPPTNAGVETLCEKLGACTPSSITRDPQPVIACAGELGQAINDVGKTLTDNDNFFDDPQIPCILQTQQRLVVPEQVGGVAVGVQLIMPGYNFSGGEAEAGGGVELRRDGLGKAPRFSGVQPRCSRGLAGPSQGRRLSRWCRIGRIEQSSSCGYQRTILWKGQKVGKGTRTSGSLVGPAMPRRISPTLHGVDCWDGSGTSLRAAHPQLFVLVARLFQSPGRT
jgi:hypothetical protein